MFDLGLDKIFLVQVNNHGSDGLIDCSYDRIDAIGRII